MTTKTSPPTLSYLDAGTTVATRDYVDHVRRALDIDDPELAQRVADFAAAEIETYGEQSAVAYFDLDGTGPWCSWCGTLAGLCEHIMLNGEKAEA